MSDSTEVAIVSRPRLPYHPAIEDRFGIDRSLWKALVEAIYPTAKSTDGVILALSYCKARGLDPMKKPVHIVPMWSTELKKMVETVWPGINEHRITAWRTGRYAGNDACEFGGGIEDHWQHTDRDGASKDIKVFHPEWAQMTVYVLLQGQRIACVGPKIYWGEVYSTIGKSQTPNDRWQRAPIQMLEKCAEAAALRRAFPEELSEPTAEEMEGKELEGAMMKYMDPPGVVPPRPTRAAPPPPPLRDLPEAVTEDAVLAALDEVVTHVVEDAEMSFTPIDPTSTSAPQQGKTKA